MIAEELMIGNWVECQSTATESIYHKVTGITNENVFLDAITFDYLTLEDINPIPITEEVLLKCKYKVINRNEIFVSFQKEGSQTLYLTNEGVTMSTGIAMQYLHQLQNRVESMEGQELEINL